MQNFKKTDKFTTHATYGQIKGNSNLNNRMPTVEEMRARFKLDTYKPPVDDNKNESYNNNFEEMAKMKQQFINGGSGIIGGIHNVTSGTTYQENFK